MNEKTRLINMFSEKIIIWGNGPFWAQKLHILITLVILEEFFEILVILEEFLKNFFAQ